MDLSAYFRAVMELSHGIVVTLDTEGRIIHGNALLEEVTGYRLPVIAGKDWFSLMVPEPDRGEARTRFMEGAHGQGIHDFKGVIRRQDGAIRRVAWRLKPLSDTGAAVPAVMMVGQDITTPADSRQPLRNDSDLTEPNRALSCLYAVTRAAENTDRDLDTLLKEIISLVPPALQGEEQPSVGLEMDGRWIQTPGFSDTDIRRDIPLLVGDVRRGSLCIATARPRAVAAPNRSREEAELLAVVARQVGLAVAKKEAMDAEQALTVQLRHADRLAKIGQLAAGVAHELNEPLANILGFAQLAAKTAELPAQVSKDLGHIVRSSLHAREVIKKLMLFSRQVPPQKIRTNLNTVIEDALTIAAASASRQGVAVTCALAADLPDITADPHQLKQVVINLAANAIQAMAGGGTLVIRTHTGERHVCMVMEDNGCGMDGPTLDQIFTPFFTTKDIDQGAGLGLSVVHGIVRAHGGSIDVHSRVGHGATFTLCFPLTE